MKKLVNALSIITLLALILTLAPAAALAQEVTCESDVTVQGDDWLSKIAEKFLGDPLAFPAIVEATNAKNASDSSYAKIADANVIEVGWKLCIPSGAEAAAALEVTSGSEFWAEAGKPYAGVTIRGISESTPPSRYAAEVLAPAFEKETGIKVEFEVTSWDQMYDKPIKDMQANTGIYDFIYIEQDIIYSYLAQNFLVDLTQMLNEKPELKSPDFDVANFTSFIDNFKDANGDVYGVPMEAFVKIQLYRKDLYSNPDIQAAFKEQYGYDLAPATTFQQYEDIAAFFTQYGKDNNMELWGTTVQGNTGHASSFYEYYESIAPTFGLYNWGIKDVGGGNYKACVANGGEMNSDVAKEALGWWVSLLQYAPPEATSSTWDEVAASFAAGRAAQGWVYGENAAWIATDDTRSKVVGNVGVALPPTAEGVMAQAESGEGYIGYYDGGAFGIPYSSKNQEAALLWLQYIGQSSVQAQWATAGSRIVMNSTFDDPLVKTQDARTDGYYTMLREQGPLFRGAPPFPFHSQVVNTVGPFIWKTLSGELQAADALDQACAAAETEMTNLGYSK
ncbi:MAG: extracellular solute-binding protein [Anaerolineales bacterium]|nr:extracellular solute-binding protein [Anaerolineales bacterium]